MMEADTKPEVYPGYEQPESPGLIPPRPVKAQGKMKDLRGTLSITQRTRPHPVRCMGQLPFDGHMRRRKRDPSTICSGRTQKLGALRKPLEAQEQSPRNKLDLCPGRASSSCWTNQPKQSASFHPPSHQRLPLPAKPWNKTIT